MLTSVMRERERETNVAAAEFLCVCLFIFFFRHLTVDAGCDSATEEFGSCERVETNIVNTNNRCERQMNAELPLNPSSGMAVRA